MLLKLGPPTRNSAGWGSGAGGGPGTLTQGGNGFGPAASVSGEERAEAEPPAGSRGCHVGTRPLFWAVHGPVQTSYRQVTEGPSPSQGSLLQPPCLKAGEAFPSCRLFTSAVSSAPLAALRVCC